MIYSYKNDGKAIYNYKDYGPTFGGGYDILIKQHGILENHLSIKLSASYSNCSYNTFYYGDNGRTLCEGEGGGAYATDFEVFQVIFE